MPGAGTDPLFSGGGATGAAMAANDWLRTPLGPPAGWPATLRGTVRMMLTSRFAMWLGWGPELSVLYNDAYRRDTVRARHPQALGRPAREVWPEIWDDIGPRIESVLDGGTATWDTELMLLLERGGDVEETYHTFSYSPLIDGAPTGGSRPGGPGAPGRADGFLCVVTEDTDRVLGERRMATLHRVAAAGAATTPDELLRAGLEQLADNAHDLPFALAYLLGPDGTAHLAATCGIAAGGPGAPRTIGPDRDAGWPIAGTADGRTVVVDDLADRFPGLPAGPWARPPDRAVALPLCGPDRARPLGSLIVGLNPHRRFDERYRTFLDLLADRLGTGLATIDAFDAQRTRLVELAELDRARTRAEIRSSVALRVQQDLTRRLELLQRATAALSVAASPIQVGRTVANQMGQLLDSRAVGVWAVRDEATLEALALDGWGPEVQCSWVVLPVDAPLPLAASARDRVPRWLEQERDWKRDFPHLYELSGGFGWASMACLPLSVGPHTLGVVAVGFSETREFAPGDRSAALALADQCALALQRAGLLAAETAARRTAEQLGHIVAALSGATTPTQVAAVIVRHLALVGADDPVVVQLVGDHLEVLSGRAAGSARRLRLADADPLAQVVRTGQPVWGAHIVLPMLLGGLPIGAIGLRPRAGAPRPGAAERATMMTVAGQCAQALDRARLQQVEHEIAAVLQASLLPRELPRLAGIDVAARYLPGTVDTRAGGDWYDLQPIDDDRVAVAVGDVVGHGPSAAAVMGQLRSTLAGYLIDGHEPAAALERLDRFAARIPGARGSSCACLILDTGTGALCWARAGHPPALVLDADGPRFLDAGAGTVLGASGRPPFEQARTVVRPGATVLLYTDGLVERRGEVVDDGLHRLADATGPRHDRDPERLLAGLVDAVVDPLLPVDDIALVALRLLPGPLQITLPARPATLRPLRRAITGWAEEIGLTADALGDLQFVVGEAASNAVEHAYPPGADGELAVTLARRADGDIDVEVRDRGRWRPEPDDPGHRGRGLQVLRTLGEDVTIEPTSPGTRVRLRFPLPAT